MSDETPDPAAIATVSLTLKEWSEVVASLVMCARHGVDECQPIAESVQRQVQARL